MHARVHQRQQGPALVIAAAWQACETVPGGRHVPHRLQHQIGIYLRTGSSRHCTRVNTRNFINSDSKGSTPCIYTNAEHWIAVSFPLEPLSHSKLLKRTCITRR